jgi:hypothetical protein
MTSVIPLPIRPVTRGECKAVARPCPYASCKYNLDHEDLPLKGRREGLTGIRYLRQLADRDRSESCALDVADRGPQPLDHVGALMGVTRERARQIEASGMAKMGEKIDWFGEDE